MSLTLINKLLNPQTETTQIIKIDEIGFNNLELVFTFGYQTICEKGKFAVGQEIIFIHNDILVDINHEIFSFLKDFVKKSEYKDGWYLVQTNIIKGYYSDGIILSPDTLIKYNLTLDTLPIKKYSKPYEQLIANYEMNYTNSNQSQQIEKSIEIPSFLNLRPGNFPDKLIPRTDEFHIKTNNKLINLLAKYNCYYTVKLDGSSMTIIYDSVTKKFTICSRNLTLCEPDNPMVKFTVKLIQEQNLEEKFKQIIEEINGENSYMSEQFLICVQGEYVGPKVNGNQMQLTSDDFYMFSVRIVIQQDESALDTPVARRWQKHGLAQNLYKGYFLDYDKLISFSQRTNIKMVPILDLTQEQSSSLEALTNYCSQLRYTMFGPDISKEISRVGTTLSFQGPTEPNFAEGIVIRPNKIIESDIFPQGFLSVKLLNPNYKIDPNQLAETTRIKD
jgi:hypothetical protein